MVGGYAVAFHGHPRYTKDIDLWIQRTRANADNVLQVLQAFGFGDVDLTADDFLRPGYTIQLVLLYDFKYMYSKKPPEGRNLCSAGRQPWGEEAAVSVPASEGRYVTDTVLPGLFGTKMLILDSQG